MSIASAAANVVAHEGASVIKAAENTGAQVIDTASVLDDIGQDTVTLAKQADNVVSDVEQALASPGFFARLFGKGKANTHLGTVGHLPKESLTVIHSGADELVLHGPQGAKFTFKREDGVVKLSTQYGEGFKLVGRDNMVVNTDQLPANIAQLMDETGFLAKANIAPPPAAIAAGSEGIPSAADGTAEVANTVVPTGPPEVG